MAQDQSIKGVSPLTLLHRLRAKTAGTDLYHAPEWKPLRQFIILAMASGPDETEKSKLQKGVCRVCGCTESTPCPGGCAWTDETETLCTTCENKQKRR